VTDPLGPVVITAREIYDQLVRVVAALDRLTDKHDEQGQDLKDHEARIRSLERGRWPLPSLAVLVSVAALVLAFLDKTGP
jgi:hypothetical protein